MAGAAATQILRGGRNGVGELVFMCLLLVVAALGGAIGSRLAHRQAPCDRVRAGVHRSRV